MPDRAAADDRLFARFHGLHWLCARLAEQRPLALLVDDAHWADEHSLRFLAYLEARIEEIPACVIVAVRTGETAAAPEALTRLIEREPRTAVRLSPLSPAAVAELVRGSLGDGDGRRGLRRVRPHDGREPAARTPAHRRPRGTTRSLDAGAIAAIGPPSVARFVAARLQRGARRRSATVAQALAILGDDASLADTAAVAGVDRERGGGRGGRLIEAELLHPGLPPRFVHPIIQQALQDSIPPAGRAQLHLAAARELARDPARCERVAAHLLAAGAAGPVGERWAFDALTAAARRAGNHGSPDQAVRFLRRALEEQAPASLRRATLLDLGAAESAARMPEAAGRMEEARALSSTPTERAHAALGLSMVRFLAGELPAAIAVCEDLLGVGRRARSRAAPGARVPGGRHPHGRRAAQRGDVRRGCWRSSREVSRGETRGGAQPARDDRGRVRGHHRTRRAEVAALAEAAWGDGRLLVEVRSEHPALAAPATTIALTAATVAIALAGRLTRAIEVWTAGVEEAQARSSMILYSNSLGLRASGRAWSGDLGGAEADAVAALALLPADDPIVAPAALSALIDVHVERGAFEQARGGAARRVADRRAAADAEHVPGAGVAWPARAADG